MRVLRMASPPPHRGAVTATMIAAATKGGQKRPMIYRKAAAAALLLALAACAQSSTPPPARASTSFRPLKIASWNLEFLAEKDGMGCQPRTGEDYAAMKRIAEDLDADVIAFPLSREGAPPPRPELADRAMIYRRETRDFSCKSSHASASPLQSIGFQRIA